MPLTSKRCPQCGATVHFVDRTALDICKCDKCEWSGALHDTVTISQGGHLQEVHDCLSCGEHYVTLPHTCKAANPPVLKKRLVEMKPVIEHQIAIERPAVGDPDADVKGAGARWNQEKQPLEFIPYHLLDEAAEVFHLVTTRKIRPYPMWNWAKGMPWLVPWACLLRHGFAWFRGEDFDTGPNGSGKRHTAHMMCNLLMIIHYEQTFPEGDNRPKKWFSAKQEEQEDAQDHDRQPRT